MKPTGDIAKLLKRMDRAVRADKRGDLLLGWRIRLWDAMRQEIGKQAAFRRNVLAFLVACDAYAAWENGRLVSAIPPEQVADYYAYPGLALDEYARFLKGKSNRKKVQSIMMTLRECSDYWQGKPHVPMQFAQIIIQNVGNRLLGLDDQVYQEHGWFEMARDDKSLVKIWDESLGEIDWCESHYFAASAAAERSKRKAEGRRDFWRHWLAETVPRVLAPMPDVRKLLQSWPGSGIRLPEKPRRKNPQRTPASPIDEIRQHLQALALPPGEQLKLYVHACQICGLARSVRRWSEESSLSSLVRKQKASRRRSLSRIQQLADDVIEDRDVNCYDYVFTREDARWTEMRKLARELLDDYGWPRKRPPKRGSLLFGMPETEATEP